MATLEKRKMTISNTRIVDDEIDESHRHEGAEESRDDITSDPVLDSLSKEPLDYAEDCTDDLVLSEELFDSLQSVKHICLVVLDMLLLQVVKEVLPVQYKHTRRLSDPTSSSSAACDNNILNSITQNTHLLQQQQPQPSCPSNKKTSLKRSNSSPSRSAVISSVHNILSTNRSAYQQKPNYTLCCSIAALLNNVYRIFEISLLKDTESINPTQQQQQQEQQQQQMQVLPLQELHDQFSRFQQEKNATTTSTSTTNQEVITLWHDIDHLMSDICTLIVLQQQQQNDPPAYDTHVLDGDYSSLSLQPPPAYESLQHDSLPSDYQYLNEKQAEKPTANIDKDFDSLIDAIEHLSTMVPRLDNQRVDLSQLQQRKAESRSRIEKQQDSSSIEDLIVQVQQLTMRTTASSLFQRQRATLTTQLQKKLEFASIHQTLNRLNRGRYINQDFIDTKKQAKEEEELCLIQDLTKTADLLIKSLDNRSCLYQSQRFSVNDTKERNFFMFGLFKKVERLEGCRLDGQDAEFKTKNNGTSKASEGNIVEDDDLEQIMNHIFKSTKPHLDNQRARFVL